jgi:urease accessory protein
MRRAVSVHASGTWPLGEAVGSITLPFADRHRRRVRMLDDVGEEFLLDLPHAVLLAEGDGLALDGGGWIAVHAADEEVAEVKCTTPEALVRIAWHIGNRHMPLQILGGGVLRLPYDPVLVTMIHGLGAGIECRLAPFHPEGGAYAQGGHHDHAACAHDHEAEPVHDHWHP